MWKIKPVYVLNFFLCKMKSVYNVIKMTKMLRKISIHIPHNYDWKKKVSSANLKYKLFFKKKKLMVYITLEGLIKNMNTLNMKVIHYFNSKNL